MRSWVALGVACAFGFKVSENRSHISIQGRFPGLELASEA